MKNHTPVISVIIPVYNVEKYLRRCLDSVLNQSFHDIEVICIDDGSTDSSLSILREYAAKDARVRVLAQSNRGVSAARNAGLDAAEGTWVTFVDSDDEVLPDIWTTLLSNIGEEDSVCFSAEEIRVQDGKYIPVLSGYFDVAFCGFKELQDKELFKLSMTVWDKLFKRSKIEACSLRFPEGLHFEDNVFVLNFFVLHRKVRFIPRKLYRYYRHEGSIMDTAFQRKQGLSLELISILEPIHDFWKRYALLPQKQAMFEKICIERFHFAMDICQPWEQAGIVYSTARHFHNWNLKPLNPSLRDISEGNFNIRLGSFIGKNVSFLHLKPLQRILYIGNSHGEKVICLFGFKLLSFKKHKKS